MKYREIIEFVAILILMARTRRHQKTIAKILTALNAQDKLNQVQIKINDTLRTKKEENP